MWANAQGVQRMLKIDTAVTWPNQKTFLFGGDTYAQWDIATDRVDPGYPARITSGWPGLWPAGLDAAVVWNNGKAHFFRGNQYIRHDIAAGRADPGFPRAISLDWPGLWPDGIDAAVAWPNGKAYFFKGSAYLRWDMASNRADPGYPRPISAGWQGLWPDRVDAAVVWPNGKAYFFRDEAYTRYDVAADRADPGYPRPLRDGWPGLRPSLASLSRIALLAKANGKFVAAENAGASALLARSEAASLWETFDRQDLGNGRFALRAMVNGKLVCAENAGTLPLIANRDRAASWESFTSVALADLQVGLKAVANGKFVCAENAGAKPLIANRDRAAAWESFRVIPQFSALHGFQFGNDFQNDFIPALDIRTAGLCGGMSYAALDFFFSGAPLPRQPFAPANGTALRGFIYNRQVASITDNLDKWAELGFNPLGARNTEFFNWGLSASRIGPLRSFLDAGTPCVLGLQGDGATGSHQVVAVGYDMGQYRGDLGAHREEFRIFVHDPNAPNAVRVLVPDLGRQLYHFLDDPNGKAWRSYFVDTKYQPVQPPLLPYAAYPADGLVHALVLKFSTGADDLRGGNDNVDLTVSLRDGSSRTYRNINRGARWIVNNVENAEVVLQQPVRADSLLKLAVSTTFGGGIGGDNWDMTSLDVAAWGGDMFTTLKSGVGPKRFTGGDKSLMVAL
jgi:hypothetical protein